jgi:hypothetical protein
MFIVLFTIAKVGNQSLCPTNGEWRRGIWYIYTMEYYSTITKNEIVSLAGKWMEHHVEGDKSNSER